MNATVDHLKRCGGPHLARGRYLPTPGLANNSKAAANDLNGIAH